MQLYPCDIAETILLKTDASGRPSIPPAPKTSQSFYLDGLGRLAPASSLPRTVFPDFEHFSFPGVTGLTPGGRYKICVMMLDRPYPGFVPLTGPDGRVREITAPAAPSSTDNPEAGAQKTVIIDLSGEKLLIPPPPAH